MTSPAMVPGEIVCDGPAVELFAGRTLLEMVVVNAGDRPIQVGSHYHFAEANPGLRFDRAAAHGKRLAIPAGTSVRFEPGIERTVSLIDLGGRRAVLGLRGQVAGLLDAPAGIEEQGASGAAAIRAAPGDETATGGTVRWI